MTEERKKSRGRLKKLAKRAKTVQMNSESGICSLSDWEELQRLHDWEDGSFGPAVHWRCEKSKDKVLGSDVRDILGRLMSTPTSCGRKRVHDEIDFAAKKLVSWVTLQNPVATRHVGVIELHMESRHDMDKVLDVLLPKIDQQEDITCIHSSVQWFQGAHPKSISDTLLYAARPKVAKPKKITGKTVAELYESLSALVVSDETRQSEDYPRIVGLSPEGKQVMAHEEDESSDLPDFVQTESNSCKSDGQPGRILGIDCEMVKTSAGSELARITLVQVKDVSKTADLETLVLWDQLVKPKRHITDYLTQYSGITAESLNGVATRLTDVQEYLLKTVRANDIVIGHSIENDMRATRWIHPRVVDTALIFRPSHARHKYSLKNLSTQLLRRQIQNGDSHCSAEDAVASLELACKRAIQGEAFGIANRAAFSLLRQWSQAGTSVCLGPIQWLQKHITSQSTSTHALDCETVTEGNSKALSAWLTAPPSRRARYVHACWRTEESNYVATINTIVDVVSKRDKSNTVILIGMQPGFKAAQDLNENRRARRNPKATMTWTEDDEERFEEAIQNCQTGHLLWVGTNNSKESSPSSTES